VWFVVTNDNNRLFSQQPTIAPNGTLTYVAAPNAYGGATVTVDGDAETILYHLLIRGCEDTWNGHASTMPLDRSGDQGGTS
jgi:hypothetical protein